MLYFEKTLREGCRDWVVVLHGLGGTIESLKFQIREYSNFYNVLAIELPGHGRSVEEPIPETYELDSVAASVVEVMDFCGIEKARFTSVSLGSLVALGVAANYPQRVVSLVQCGGILRFEWYMRIFALPAIWASRIFSHVSVYRFFAGLIFPGRKHWIAQNIFIRGASQMVEKVFYAWIMFMLGRGRRLEDYIRKLNSAESLIPQLYVLGDEDFLFRKSTPRLARKISDAVTVIIENAEHICNIEQRKEFNRISLEFFATQGKPTNA